MLTTNEGENPVRFLSDKDVAEMLSVTPSWVRKQRYLRKKGLKHTLLIDPIYVGTLPRYPAADVNGWLATL